MKKRIFILIPFLLLSGCKGKRISYEEAQDIASKISLSNVKEVVLSKGDFKVVQEEKTTTVTPKKTTKTTTKQLYEISYSDKWFYLYRKRTVDDNTDINEDWFYIRNDILYHSSSRQVEGKIVSQETYDLSNSISYYDDVTEGFDNYIFGSRKLDVIVGSTQMSFTTLWLTLHGSYVVEEFPELQEQKYYSSGPGNMIANLDIKLEGDNYLPNCSIDFKANYEYEDFHLKRIKIKSKSNGYVNSITGEYIDQCVEYNQSTKVSNHVKVTYPNF